MRISSCRFFSIMSSSSCSIAFARSSFSMPLREKIFTPTMMPSIPDVARLLAEDRAEQLLFRCQLRLALRRDFADQDVSGLDRSTDSDNPALIEVTQVTFADVRDVAGDFLRAQLRVPRLDLELLDVDRRVVVVLHHPLGDEDRVLEVVAAPRHERDEHVPPERQLAQLRAGAVAEHLALVHLLAHLDDRPLVDARV